MVPERIIGIVGGMGPEATADLFREITRLTPAVRDQDHVQVLIYSNPKIPDRTKAILNGTDDPLPALIATARKLEGAGAGILAIPCNTAHFFLPQLQAAVCIPILNMIEEALLEVRRIAPHSSAAGLLASTGTIRSRVYESSSGLAALRILTPDAGDQEKVQNAIYDIKAGTRVDGPRRIFEATAHALMNKGADIVIHGCTEIPLAFQSTDPEHPCLNPTRVLARAAVNWALDGRV